MTLQAAITRAKEQSLYQGQTHIIHAHGSGYNVVPRDFCLDRQYYHGKDGRKQFFTHMATYDKGYLTYPDPDQLFAQTV